jgi:hypothetical protein
MTSKNIGDLLNTAEVSWGSFMGGFDLTRTNINQLRALDLLECHQRLDRGLHPASRIVPVL